MKTFIVGHVDWFDHDLVLEKVQAETWQEAVCKHSKSPFGSIGGMSVDEVKRQCFDMDCMMSWIEV